MPGNIGLPNPVNYNNFEKYMSDLKAWLGVNTLPSNRVKEEKRRFEESKKKSSITEHLKVLASVMAAKEGMTAQQAIDLLEGMVSHYKKELPENLKKVQQAIQALKKYVSYAEGRMN